MAKLVRCKTCGERIAKSAKICPHCGAKKKPGALRVIFGLFFLFVGIILLAAAIATMSPSPKSPSGENPIQALSNTVSKSLLEEVDPPQIAVDQFGLRSISGSMKNISGTTLSYAQIIFALFDSQGAQVGTAVANINNLVADAVWKYSATPLTTEPFASFQLSEINAF